MSDRPKISTRLDCIEVNYGKRFPFKKSYMLYVFLVIAALCSFLLPFDVLLISLEIIFLFLILFLYTANTGIIINADGDTKFYMSAFWVKVGEWRKTRWHNCIVLKTTPKKRENSIVNIIGDEASVVEKFITTDIYLMDSSHRRKLFCGSFDLYVDAKTFAQQLSEELDYPIEKFSPKRISRI